MNMDISPSGNVKKMSCCNANCGLTDETKLQIAPSYVLSYFGRKRKQSTTRDLARVCEICYELAGIHKENMYEALTNHKSLFRLDFPKRNDVVVVLDSDSDTENDDLIPSNECLPDEMVHVFNENLQDVIDDTITKYDLPYQLKEADSVCVERLDLLSKECTDILAVQNSNQTRMDRLRQDMYAFLSPKPTQLNPVEIIDLVGPMSSQQILTPPIVTFVAPAPVAKGGVAMKKVTQVHRTYSGQHHALPQTSSSASKLESVNTEVVALKQFQRVPTQLPPIGILQRPVLKPGDVVYAMKLDLFGIWAKAQIIEVLSKESEEDSDTYYHVKFCSVVRRKNAAVRVFTGKQLAYSEICDLRFPVGTRIVALFKEGDSQPDGSYYAGVIAEPPKLINKFRYLIFFDDGYTQYVPHEKILLVVDASPLVCDDVHPDTSTFIKQYMLQYPERPMVKVALGQSIKTEWNGKWWLAKVIEIDCSLCNMHFLADNRTEWLYRGSTRLSPLYNEMARTQQLSGVPNTVDPQSSKRCAAETPPVSRSVAKKSTAGRPILIEKRRCDPSSEQQNNIRPSKTPMSGFVKLDTYNVTSYPNTLKFVPHQCLSACVERIPYNASKLKHCALLAVPLLCAWRREIIKYRNKKAVVYKAPCGRRIRNIVELSRYLRITKCKIGVDFFNFEFWVSCTAEFVDCEQPCIKDLSYGKELIPVPCVNFLDHDVPKFVEYVNKREPVAGVKLNLDPEFLIGCDCTDGCSDKDNCACWQLTFAGTAFSSGKMGVLDSSIGYNHKRLNEPVVTGIYECNSRCKCSSTCCNRVVQNPLRCKLQVFKTENRGWGIRSINDMPQGSFICIYAGKLLDEHEANEDGKNNGDEYLAELDYIEVVERLKEGYEEHCKNVFGEFGSSDEIDDASSFKKHGEDEMDYDDGDDVDYEINSHSEADGKTRLKFKRLDGQKSRKYFGKYTKKVAKGRKDRPKKKIKMDTAFSNAAEVKPLTVTSIECISISDDEDASAKRTRPLNETFEEVEEKPLRFKSIRHYFNEPDMCYIMDAKTSGNIGRYLNHSCTPNVFVQNVFVDTHDLRFPWVAFFALSYISAGTELTWDYNYDIGSVKDKVLFCRCGSADCRGRLL